MWAHPRWRGEHSFEPIGQVIDLGSSPLARGALGKPAPGSVWSGLIPAGAGSTSPCVSPGPTVGAHPRWRGEHSRLLCPARSALGSSPLARGAQTITAFPPTSEGLIPAGAGSTESPTTRKQPSAAHPRWRGEHSPGRSIGVNVMGSSPLARGAPHGPSRPHPRPGLIPAGAGSTLLRFSGRGRTWAHPRWRGEHIALAVALSDVSGSSPLARGAHIPRCVHKPRLRLIPAGAGSTTPQSRCRACEWAHPRWRGEHRRRITKPALPCGSSPLARGAPTLRESIDVAPGLIPAGAGSTRGSKRARCAPPAHPRWRGEHSRVRIARALPAGSSPLARGALLQHHVDRRRGGLIPAGAGSTLPRPVRVSSPGAHPRWRGEHCWFLLWSSRLAGSSPLARGALRVILQPPPHGGLIPAGAGSTTATENSNSQPPAHPRWRGEHGFSAAMLPMYSGSSPLARGARRCRCSRRGSRRLIPAGAGSTSRWTRCASRLWAHPRWRGEHINARQFFQTLRGSSPLARGAHMRIIRPPTQRGLIPAGAGSTPPAS
ncbi:Domain of uncharacterised function (DUF2825) [Corynebacterium urealyticum]|nr:Domain of uncharacterised function (DUF2825) [Corynebacterium urealyticum]